VVVRSSSYARYISMMKSRALIAVAAVVLAGCATMTSGSTPVIEPVTGPGVGLQVKPDQAAAIATQASIVQTQKPIAVSGTAVGRGTSVPQPLGSTTTQAPIEPAQPAAHANCSPTKGIACGTP